MSNRTNLQTLLEGILGSQNVYFQPPATVRMQYPAIVYERSDIVNKHADDIPYMQNRAYSITVIDKNPDSTIVDAVAKLPMCRFNRHFKSDNLNHDVFTLYIN